jgi:hypothetical protein
MRAGEARDAGCAPVVLDVERVARNIDQRHGGARGIEGGAERPRREADDLADRRRLAHEVAEVEQRLGPQVDELALGDIAHDADQRDHVARGIEAEVGIARDPAQGAVVGPVDAIVDRAGCRAVGQGVARHDAAAIGLGDERLQLFDGIVGPHRKAEEPARRRGDRDAVAREIDLERADAAGLLRVDEANLLLARRHPLRMGGDDRHLAIEHRAAHGHDRDDLARQRPQRVRLRRREAARARHTVDDAERADRHALRRPQRRAGVETDMRGAGHQGVGARARVGGEVRNHQQVRLDQRMDAHRLAERRLAGAEADAGLEPLPLGADEAHERRRRIADQAGDLHDVVELGLRRGVENVVARESLEAGVKERQGENRPSVSAIEERSGHPFRGCAPV